MSLDKFLVLILGGGAIVFTYWFFLMKREMAVAAEVANSTGSLEVDILVDGGYTPSAILLEQGKAVTLNFLRKDPSSCLEEVVVPEFRIKRFLPINQKVSISVTPKLKGKFAFSCGMGMYHGKIIVR